MFKEKVKAKVLLEFGESLDKFEFDGKKYRCGHNKHICVIGTEFVYKGNIKKYATIFSFKEQSKRFVLKSWDRNEETKYFNRTIKTHLDKVKLQEKEEREEALLNLQNYWLNKLHKGQLTPCKTHEYLNKKGFPENPLKTKTYLYRDLLVIPAYKVNGDLMGIQFINPEGKKVYKKGSIIQSSFFSFTDFKEIEHNKTVVLAEGLATALTVFKVLKTPTLVYFSAGNLENVLEHIPKGTEVIVAIDNDIASLSSTGRKTFEKVNKKYNYTLKGICPKEDGDWNDFYLKHGLEATEKEINRQLESKNDKEPIFLGYENDKNYVFCNSRKILYSFSYCPDKRKLLTIVPEYNYFYRFANVKEDGTYGAINWDKAGAYFVRACQAKGSLDSSDFKGSGVFKTDKNNIVISSSKNLYDHIGNKINGCKADGEFFIPMYEYPRPVKTNENMKEDFQSLLECFSNFSWQDSESGLILASWIPLSMIGGALSWRPHLWLHGTSSSGKSSTLKLIYRKLLREFSIGMTKGTTVAGFTRKISQNSKAILFDEFETESKETAKLIQEVLEVARNSNSSDFASFKADRSSSHGTVKFSNFSCFLLSSINVGFESDADEDRIVTLRFNEDKITADQYASYLESIRSLNYPSIKQNLWGYALENIDAINRLYIKKMQDQTIDIKGHRKSLYSILSASSEIFYDKMLTIDQFFVDRNDRQRECLDVLLYYIPKEFGCNWTVLDMLREAKAGETKTSLKILDSIGLKLSSNYLAVAINHPYLGKIYKETKWVHKGWARGLPSSSQNSRIINGVSKRCVLIPLSKIGLG